MSIAVKGDMYCPRCDTLTTGQKTTHRARGAAVAATALSTGGASLLFARVDPFVCSDCGAPVADITGPRWAARVAVDKARRQEVKAQARAANALAPKGTPKLDDGGLLSALREGYRDGQARATAKSQAAPAAIAAIEPPAPQGDEQGVW